MLYVTLFLFNIYIHSEKLDSMYFLKIKYTFKNAKKLSTKSVKSTILDP